MKKLQLGLWAAFVVCLLAGCTNYEEDYARNTLIVKRNASLVEVAVEDFKESTVKAEDLSAYIEEQVENYNNTIGEKMIKEQVINTEDMSNVKLVLKYKDMESYNGFNLLECVLDDFANVEKDKLEGTFTSADGNTVKIEDMENVEKAKVLILSEAVDVVIKGNILYYNGEVSVEDDVAVTTGEKNAVIIYK